ncbi:hypothetical protein [Thermobrachium celere]|uniref:Uncharacterized protein n=1 Tax=Thermobrachium celere DSM 8682 TaxID=941824 RepID=R7RNT6_9CLOT|nr:hypothetical protein [Thermobrachium celere]CDF57709.1 hypothetical protein TCEL_01623 [Thermobrachium celere DSM 8682]
MLVYQRAEGRFKEISDKYRNKNEVARVSLPIEYNGRLYREIQYNKVFLGSVRQTVTGYLYVTEEGEKVLDKKDIKELAYLAYQFEVLFDDVFKGGIPKAVIDEKQLKKEEKDFEKMLIALDALKAEGLKDVDKIEEAFSKLTALKRENNRALEELINKVNSLSKPDLIFSREVLNEIMPYYREALLKNFKKIKLINSTRNQLDDVKQALNKKRKALRFRILSGTELMDCLNRLEYGIDYFKKVLTVYSSVADMTEGEYIKYLDNMDRKNVEEKLSKLK